MFVNHPQQCSRCAHWEVPEDRRASAAMAGCPIAGRRVAFDETCSEWRSFPVGPQLRLRPDPPPSIADVLQRGLSKIQGD